MGSLDKIWIKVKWVITYYFKTKKKLYPLAVLGTRIMVVSMGAFPALGWVLKLIFPEGFLVSNIQFDSQSISSINNILAVAGFLIGAFLILIDVKRLGEISRSTSKALITGMLATSARFPIELLTRPEQLDSRETVELGIPEFTVDSIRAQVNMFNSEVAVRIYERFILNQNCKILYLGGLARVPFLVAYGSCFRAVSAEIIYFDRFHSDGSWKLLDDEEQNIQLIHDEPNSISPNGKGHIGISISFTQEIRKEQLPTDLKQSTLSVKSNLIEKRNLITNQRELERLSSTIQGIIDHYSSLPNCKEIHFFISAQSTVALEIGRRFQEGIHKKWVVHNYDASKGCYDWGIEVNKDHIKEY
nr:SAVED domain-containing protein [uncultured Desulfobacter sp.]